MRALVNARLKLGFEGLVVSRYTLEDARAPREEVRLFYLVQ